MSYLDLHVVIDGAAGKKRNFTAKDTISPFSIMANVNFPFICSNISAADAYVYIYISLCDILEFDVSSMISLIDGCY